jgi:hypothetical protein
MPLWLNEIDVNMIEYYDLDIRFGNEYFERILESFCDLLARI